MAQDIDWEELRFEIDGLTAIAPCFAIECHTWLQDGVLDFYRRARAALGPLITHYETEGTRGARPLDARAETIVPTWLERLKFLKDYWICFKGCEDRRGVTPAWLELFFFEAASFARSPGEAEKARAAYRKISAEGGRLLTPDVMTLRVAFPLDHELADPARALPWIYGLDAVRSYPFLSGQAGYALNVNQSLVGPDSRRVADRLRSLLLRYPGLDWYDPGGASERVLRYDAERSEFFPVVKRASWLNLVSDATAERLGGRERVRSELEDEPQVAVHDLPHGVAIQAGPAPEPGDMARRDFLPVYRRVAKVLRPVRLEKFERMALYLGDEAAEDWLNAFDREYDGP